MTRLKAGYEMGRKFAQRHALSGVSALDIGAGHCAHTTGFADFFDRVDALDQTAERYEPKTLLELSPSAKKIRFLEMDAHDIDRLGQYDLVYSLSAMEHMYDWRQIMKKIPFITKKWFYLVISPLYYSPLGHHIDPQVDDWDHILLPEDELKTKFFKNGGVDWMWNTYKELNKVTAAELIEEAKKRFDITYLKASITTIEMLCQKK